MARIVIVLLCFLTSFFWCFVLTINPVIKNRHSMKSTTTAVMSAEKDKGIWFAVIHALPCFTCVVFFWRRWFHVVAHVSTTGFELDFLILRSQPANGSAPIAFEIFQWLWLCRNTKILVMLKHQNIATPCLLSRFIRLSSEFAPSYRPPQAPYLSHVVAFIILSLFALCRKWKFWVQA